MGVDQHEPHRAARRGRPRKLDPEQIADAVIRTGFTGLSVDALAATLGVGTATLYRYVTSRRELLALAWDRLVARTTWPDDDRPWDELLTAHAVTLWRLSASHPGAISELASGPMPPAMMRLYDDPTVALIRRGFSADDALLAVDSVIDLTIDHRLGVERLDELTPDRITLRAELASSWSQPGPGEHTEERARARAAMSRAIDTDPERWFERKLSLVLAGIRARLAPTS